MKTQTKPYDVAKQLHTEDERAAFIEAMELVGACKAEMAAAHDAVRRSRAQAQQEQG